MPESAQGRAEVTGLLRRHGLEPRRRLGQHFLVDPNIVRKIVAAARIQPGDHVLEVGAGTGTLTAALAGAGARVLAFEVDERLRPVLEEALPPGVEVRYEDAAAVDFPALLGEGSWLMVSNLPYNVGTPVLLDLVRHAPTVTRFVVMVQLEVAERLGAAPGSRRYGLPSVVAQLHCDTQTLFTVSPAVFVPAPPVESAVVELLRKPAPPAAERAIELASTAFGQRRKMVRRSLADTVDEADLVAAGIDPTDRAEDLTPLQYLTLAGG